MASTSSLSTSQSFNHPNFSGTLLPYLRELLPYSLPLYRRLQFPFHSASSHVFASFPPGTDSSESSKTPRCFAAAFLDRSRRPETECFLFLSSEAPGRCNSDCTSCKSAILTLISHLKTIPLPDSVHGIINTGGQAYLNHLSNPNIILIGGVHTRPAKFLEAADLIDTAHPGLQFKYVKYLFKTSTLPKESDLPDSLVFRKVRPSDFPLVRSRTAIPRQDATLALLPSMAIYPPSTNGEPPAPIAWTFLGLDASLSSLHVELDWRGKGLAKKVASAMFRDRIVYLGEGEEDPWAHADVAMDNEQSKGVCKSLGGKEGWTVYWIRVDLGRVN
ncbi:hypothetical protein EJ08DRAFT_603856 [Tothia fuscella]|uniref:GCN5-related N-acetyltransferase Rv2170-like domain-containing protein n=1 Tax=Tothia fuscella TaxID=1048955 RepID=A0A9P4P385_9PEZI|nr:hypothetical protein EJ08DRAFT_603856 [Tothia fuscella]